MTVKEIIDMRDEMEREMAQKGRELEDAISDLEETPINKRMLSKLRENVDRVNEALNAYTDAVDNLVDFENQSFDIIILFDN